MSSSCFNSMIRISRLGSCRNSEAKRPWRSGGTRAWAYGGDHDGFEVSWGALIHWSCHQVVRWQWFEQAASGKNQTRNYEDACLLWWEQNEVFVSPGYSAWFPSHSQGHVYRLLCCRTVDMMMQMTYVQFKRKYPNPLNRHMFVTLYMCTFFSSTKVTSGARGSAVGWGTALQVGRSRVRFLMVSLEFFIDIIFPAALWPWGWLSL